MKYRLKRVLSLLTILGLSLLIFGCGKKETEEALESEVVVSSEETVPSESENTESIEVETEEIASSETETEEVTKEPEMPFVLPTPVCQTEVMTDSLSYCVIDDDGMVWLEKNALMHLKPASTTKVLTALVAYENCSLDDMVTISEEAINSIDIMSSGVEPPLRPGEVMSVKDLLYALMLPSTNAAGNVLAEHVAGSMEAFQEMMNAKCKALGLQNSHFVNAHGLDREEHYSSAYDLSVIMREACKYADLVQIMRVPTYTLDATNLTGTREIHAGHSIINGSYTCEGVFAGKPGWTVGANSTLLTAVERYGKKFYICVMNSDERVTAVDTINLIETVYESYASVPANLKPLIHDVSVVSEDYSGVTLKLTLDGNVSSMRTVHWNNDYGSAAAIFQNPEAQHEMTVFLPMTEAATYTVQLFATNAAGEEYGMGLQVLFTGAMKVPGQIQTAFGQQYYLNDRGLLMKGVIEFPAYAMVTNGSGALIYNSFTDDGLFYCDENGHVISGWKEIMGYTYYFQSDGAKMRNGSMLIDGVMHTFDENGVLLE